jgi:two-component sensor histidine kinase
VTQRVTGSEELYHILGVENQGNGISYQDLFKLIHPDDLIGQTDFLPLLENMQEVGPITIRILRSDEAWRTIQVTIAQVDLNDNKLARIFGTVLDISERRKSEDDLLSSLAEKEVLIREVHHRVKNNLSIILGLLALQQSGLEHSQITASFNELAGRIRSISLVHELLYQSEKLSKVNLQTYLGTLIDRLYATLMPAGGIQVVVNTAFIDTSLDTAIPCGLIVNELVTNSLKYAFPGGKPALGQQECRLEVNGIWDRVTYTLNVKDNGIGLPAGFKWQSTESLGLQLVTMLAQRQLDGSVEVETSQGTNFRIQFSPGEGTP